ncbi:MAG: hypothetical protein WAK44_12830 [Trebonia sp.]|uniref:hypothetical protein n=1 Tax=Trebonia sp. TaxID=2767075 RepID=UPI003BAE8DD6
MHDDEFGDTGTDDIDDIEDEIAWLLRPQWLHPDCRNACAALELGTCCKYPDNPLVRVAVDLAESVDRTLGRFGAVGAVIPGDESGNSASEDSASGDGAGDCAGPAAELARLFSAVPGLLAQVHAILPRLNATAIAQLLCPVGRLAGALDQACAYGCPWACRDRGVPDRRGRRAGLEPLRPLLAESAHALRAALTGSGR